MYSFHGVGSSSNTSGEENFGFTKQPQNPRPTSSTVTHGLANYQQPNLVQPYQQANIRYRESNQNKALFMQRQRQPNMVQHTSDAHFHNKDSTACLSISDFSPQKNAVAWAKEPFLSVPMSVFKASYPDITNDTPCQLSSHTCENSHAPGSHTSPQTIWGNPLRFPNINGGMSIEAVLALQDQVRRLRIGSCSPNPMRTELIKPQAIPIMGEAGEVDEPPLKKRVLDMDSSSKPRNRFPARTASPVLPAGEVSLISVPSQYVNLQGSPPKVRRKLAKPPSWSAPSQDVILQRIDRLNLQKSPSPSVLSQRFILQGSPPKDKQKTEKIPPQNSVAELPQDLTVEVQFITMDEALKIIGKSPPKRCPLMRINNEKKKETCNKWLYACEVSEHLLKEHVLTHSKAGNNTLEEPCLWDDCAYKSPDLLRHTMGVHFRVRHFCPVATCKHLFTRRHLLNGHIREVHYKVQKDLLKRKRTQSSYLKDIEKMHYQDKNLAVYEPEY